MSRIKTTARNGYLCIAMCLCFLFTLLPAAGAAPDNRTKTIRAAWYEDSDHITGEKGERSGYGYEYEQAVASYTG